MVIEIIKIAYGKGFKLRQHVFPVHKRVMKLHEQFFRALRNPVMVFDDAQEHPVFLGNVDDCLGSFQIDFQRR